MSEDRVESYAPLPAKAVPIPAPAVQQAAGQGATIYPFPTMPAAAAPAAPTAPTTPPLPLAPSAATPDVRSQAVAYFTQKGLPIHVAQGIADNIQRESGGNPTIPGDGGASVGLFQAHDDRMQSLQKNPNWQTPQAQFDWAWQQMHGGDQIATQNFNKIAGARTREEANAAFKDYFERPAGSVGGQMDAQRVAGSAELQRIAADTHKIMEEISRTGGRDPKMFQMLSEARQKMAEYEERALKLAEQGPKNDPRDVMQRMGGVATVIGVLGGLLTKQPLMAALNAGGAAMEAYNKQDEVAYKANVDQWRYHIEALQKMGQIQHDLIRDTLADEKLEQGEKMSRLQAMLSALGNERLAEVAKLGDERQLAFHRDTLAQSDRQFIVQMRRLDDMENKGWQILTDPTKKDEAGNPIQYRYNPNTGEATTLDRQPFTPGGAQKVGTTSQSAGSPEQVKTAAEAIAKYQMAPMSGYAMRSPYGQAVMAEVFKINPEYQATQYSGQQAAASATGRRASTLTIASNAADQMIPIVQDLSHKVDRTNYPTINRILLAGREKFGDPDVVAFGQALNSLLYVYMRALNPSGIPRVADLERGEHMLQTAWSQGQLDSVIAQMKREIGAEKTAVQLSSHEMNTLFSGEDPLKIKPDQMEIGGGGAAGLGGELPSQARSQLKEGQETEFGNGQVWTLQNDTPKRVR